MNKKVSILLLSCLVSSSVLATPKLTKFQQFQKLCAEHPNYTAAVETGIAAGAAYSAYKGGKALVTAVENKMEKQEARPWVRNVIRAGEAVGTLAVLGGLGYVGYRCGLHKAAAVNVAGQIASSAWKWFTSPKDSSLHSEAQRSAVRKGISALANRIGGMLPSTDGQEQPVESKVEKKEEAPTAPAVTKNAARIAELESMRAGAHGAALAEINAEIAKLRA